mmetsp:Transcript_28752/g.52395  ORF Transcript_28752/g.52395 Transcript_28752/m.52395 type:complete len:206 (-) Transcript_28752:77-694(-)
MALENRRGKMVLSSSGIGSTTFLTEWANLFTLVETVTSANSRLAWLTASALTSQWTQAVRRCAVSGEMICRMAMAQRPSLMARNIGASMPPEGSMAMVCTCGPMVQSTLVVGSPIASTAWVTMWAWMDAHSRDIGEKLPWMDWVSTRGRMDESTVGSTEMTASMALAFSIGRTVGVGKGGGPMVTNMDMVSATTQWVSLSGVAHG